MSLKKNIFFPPNKDGSILTSEANTVHLLTQHLA